MIRMATQADIPAILDIYGPYVLHTAVSFEYSVPLWRNLPNGSAPSPPNSPGLFGRKQERSWAMPTAVFPLAGRPTGGGLPAPSILPPRPRAEESAENYTKHWKPSLQSKATARPMPSSPLTIPVPCVSTGRQASVSWRNFPTAELNLINFTVSFGWKKL